MRFMFTKTDNHLIMYTLSSEVEYMPHKLLVLICLLSFTVFTAAQTEPAASNAKAAEAAAELVKQAVELLRETSGDVGGLCSVENRISFNAELASLMWFHDEKEARAMYASVIGEFKQLVLQLDMQNNLPKTTGDEDDASAGIMSFYGKTRAERKLKIAMAVRQQIALSLAEHAPDLAFNFYYDTVNMITDPEIRKQTEQTDKYFESSLMRQVGEADPVKASDLGKQSIKKGIQNHHIGLLEKIYAKNTDKGIEFGAEILSKLKSDRSAVKDLEVYSSLLSAGAKSISEAKTGKKALYEKNDLRDIANQFALALLENKGEPDEVYMAESWAEEIDKYAPGRGAQVRAKYKKEPAKPAAVETTESTTELEAATAEASRVEKERAEREKAGAQMLEDIKGLENKPLSSEERGKVVTKTRGIIAQTPGREKKIMALGMLAAQVARAGDKELAGEIMRDAERLVNPQPKNYQDFMFSLMLASAYAETNPDKAFPLLTDTIARVNETISAAIKLAEFIDVTGEMVEDGEVQVGSFGGSMIRELTKELGMATPTIRLLANADFTRTKGLANNFDRSEVRVLAKMMVLRAVLGDRAKKDADLQDPEQGGVLNAPVSSKRLSQAGSKQPLPAVNNERDAVDVACSV